MLAQVLFSGLALGSIYGLVALGFTLIFKATEVFNFAQGMFAVCGAFLRYTSIGLLMRATADSHEAAMVAGVSVNRVNRTAWGIGTALAAVGGLFLGQLQIASVELEAIGLLAVPAVVLGGLQSIPGAIIGGLLVGVIEQLAAAYVSMEAADILIFSPLLLILMVRPWGLFGQRELGRV